ncbi:MAG: T9SS type A sorting domain-containing protein [Bacteroidetes bacterium]|nr:T9SS type A sorting domain-containing protein [Bacteroidota bacterium]MCK5764756.1 T9SS type A sorting domain-containing protein [Bacteroidales bacterium]
MPKVLITFLFIILFTNSFTQNTFEYLLSNDKDQEIFDVIEDQDGNFAFVGRIKNSQADYSDGYIFKIGSNGELLDELTIHQDTIGCSFYNIHIYNDAFFVLGNDLFDTQISYSAYLWLMQLNSDLTTLNEWVFNIPNDRWFVYMKSIVDSDTNIVITGYTMREDTVGFSPYNFDPFFYKISRDGDSLVSKFMTLPFSLTMSTDILEKSDTSGYYAYCFAIADLPQAGQRYELSKNLDSIDIVGVPYWIYGYISSISLYDSIILISGEGGPPQTTPDYSINVLTLTEDNIPIDYNYFKIEGNMRDRTAYLYGLGKNEDNIYVGGTSNIDFANPYYSSLDSWYHLIKVNPDLTPIWEYWYGGDAYYHLYSIEATNDAGCIMVGTRYDDAIQYMERDIYILKVNSDGLLVGTDENPSIKMREALIFPNPGNNHIEVRIAAQHLQSKFELYDMSGKHVLTNKIHGKWGEVNTTALKTGTYIYLIYNSEGLFEQGKWIKQ